MRPPGRLRLSRLSSQTARSHGHCRPEPRLIRAVFLQPRRQLEAQLLAEFARRKTRRHQAVGEEKLERLRLVDPGQRQLREINLRRTFSPRDQRSEA